ncbi:MAG TPA: response regulator, partial [Candidatus Aerophobetes bacterium]|nr:response regulator [Candidatus Aerophobetes bacterium]
MNKKGSVLVVDDEVSICEGCKKILLKEGLYVDTAKDGLEAKEKIRREKFDLVLVDLKLPQLSGEDLLHWLHSSNPDIVPVVITGYPSFDGAVTAVKEGAYDYIPKPFTSGELRRVVRRGLERKWLIQEMRRLREEQEKNLKLLSQERTKPKSVINSMTDGVLVVNRLGELVL